jgi:V/A-type H+-transporting ATPase subunit A
MARIIGKDALPQAQQLTLLCAALVNEAFLRQSALSEVDRVCTPARQAAMMRLLGRFLDLAQEAQAAGVHPDEIAKLPCLRLLQRMSEEVRNDELAKLAELQAAVEREFASLARAGEGADAAHG